MSAPPTSTARYGVLHFCEARCHCHGGVMVAGWWQAWVEKSVWVPAFEQDKGFAPDTLANKATNFLMGQHLTQGLQAQPHSPSCLEADSGSLHLQEGGGQEAFSPKGMSMSSLCHTPTPTQNEPLT